ncbi:hypothetical protein Tco_0628265 [Tanacetum coccineum]|uniref:Uncharacterized protein n=1 Tax=Tanacetum coccineum TaxID=301880 RepID=A0ABQ4WQ04_9ASTR
MLDHLCSHSSSNIMYEAALLTYDQDSSLWQDYHSIESKMGTPETSVAVHWHEMDIQEKEPNSKAKKLSSNPESTEWKGQTEDDLEILSTEDPGLDWIYAHNFLTRLQKLSSYASRHLEVFELAACLEKLHFPALLVMSKYSRIYFSFVILEVLLSEYFGFDMNSSLNFLCSV